MGDDEVDRTLWCGGGLHDRVNEEILWELFLQAGPLEKVKLVKEKGFGFITFKHAESVPYTIELMNGIPLYGKQLKLQFRPNSIHDARAKGLVPPNMESPLPGMMGPPLMGPPMMGLPSHMMGPPAQFHRSMSSPSMMESPPRGSRYQNRNSPPTWEHERDRSSNRNDYRRNNSSNRSSDSDRSYSRDEHGRSSNRGNERERQQNYDRSRRGGERERDYKQSDFRSGQNRQERNSPHDRGMMPRSDRKHSGKLDADSAANQQTFLAQQQAIMQMTVMNPYGGAQPPWQQQQHQGRRPR